MKHSMLSIMLVLSIAFVSTIVSAQDSRMEPKKGGCCSGGQDVASLQDHSQHKHKADSASRTNDGRSKKQYACPMHPEVTSDKPGSCPKCKMDLVEVKALSLSKQKRQAIRDGKYSCCLKDACDECLKAHGSCNCRKAVKEGKPVCNECYEGWQKGQGDVPGKTAKDIKQGHKH